MRNIKIALVVVLVAFLAVAVSQTVSASWECTPNGERIPHGSRAGDICRNGCCIICVGSYLLECAPRPLCTCGGSSATDLQAPTITINSPQEGQVFTTDRVIFSFSLDEVAEFAKRKLDNDRSPSIFCRDCSQGSFEYIRLKDGPHSLTLIAIDQAGNEAQKTVNFFVDGNAPVITRTYPEGGFAKQTMNFKVEYTEETQATVQLHYGVNPNDNVITLTCPIGKKVSCERSLDLTSFNGATLKYFFTVNDGFNTATSPTKSVVVDATPPVITIVSPAEGAAFTTNDINLQVSLSEQVALLERQSDKESSKRKFCSDCQQQSYVYRRMNDGQHTITVFATDAAGNSAQKTVNFKVDSTAPKILDTLPDDEAIVTSTTPFTLVYDEETSVNITLHYGQHSDTVTKQLNGCPKGKKQSCSIQLDLAGYNGVTLKYYFTITDGFNSMNSEVKTLHVDTTKPVVSWFSPINDHVYPDKRINLKADITNELVNYIEMEDDLGDGKTPKPKKVCTRDCSGVDKVLSFNDGDHVLLLRAVDFAGNEALLARHFIVDSKEPKIRRSYPASRGYTNGSFIVEYNEENTREIALHWKEAGTENAFTVVKKTSCPGSSSTTNCVLTTNLASMNNKMIEYYFSMKDDLYETTDRKSSTVGVDTVPPVLTTKPLQFSGSKVFFNLSTSEIVNEISYVDQLEARPSTRRVCSNCNAYAKYVSFKSGPHQLKITAYDKAGNSDTKIVSFTI